MTFPSDYSTYDLITINHNKISSGGVTNIDIWFPKTSLSNTAQSAMLSDGSDARFTLNDGVTQLARDVIRDSSGQLVGFRINMPSISDQDDSNIRCWYNGSDSDLDANNIFGKYAAYHSNIKGHWPLGETPSGSAPQMLDRTSNAHHGAVATGMDASNLITAQVGKGLSLSSGQYVNIGDQSELDPHYADFYISAWIRTSDLTYYPAIISKGTSWDDNGYAIVLDQSTGKLRPKIKGYSGNQNLPTSPNCADGNWHHIVVNFDRSGAGTVSGWVDGVSAGSYTSGYTTTDISTSAPFVIGISSDLAGDRWIGDLDEIRMGVGSLLTQAVVVTQFNNESDPSTFFSSVVALTTDSSQNNNSRRFPVIGSSIIKRCYS